MREIKFRTWVEGKGMFYFTIDELLRSTVHSEGVTYSGGDMTYVWSKGISMQYTGLKDKNGTPIYEGDIIPETDYMNLPTKRLSVVTMGEHDDCDGGTAYGWYLEGSSFNRMPFPADEVIGNIYENPELIK